MISLLNQMDIDMYLCGHQHELMIFEPGLIEPETKLTYNSAYKSGTYKGYLTDFNFPSFMVSKPGFTYSDDPELYNSPSHIGFYVDAEGYIFPLHPTYTAPVPVVDGAIPVDLPADYKGPAEDPYAKGWIDGVLTMHRFISSSRNWQRGIQHIRVRPGGDLVLTIKGRDEQFIVGQPEDVVDKLGRIDRYIGLIAPSKPEGYYKTVNVKYNQQIICRQKDI